MKPTQYYWSEVKDIISRIRSSHRARHLTNYFEASMSNKLLAISSDSAVLFASLENGFGRLFYFSADLESLRLLLLSWPNDLDYVIGYVDRIKNEHLCAVFCEAGFIEKCCYQRMLNLTLPIRKVRVQPEYARIEETAVLYDMFSDTFDAMTDHLPELEKLSEIVAADQVIVKREKGEITGVLLFQMHGKQVNFNYLVNRGKNGLDLLELKNSFYHIMYLKGIQSGFLWVNTSNSGVIKLHQNFGWKLDSLYDWFFIRRIS
jgi:hypothetical protein